VACIVQTGDAPISITWTLKGDVVSSQQGLSTAQIGVRASILSIDSVGYRHSGVYTCLARNKAGSMSHSAELKVNGTSSSLSMEKVDRRRGVTDLQPETCSFFKILQALYPSRLAKKASMKGLMLKFLVL
jgi:hypothetical protein